MEAAGARVARTLATALAWRTSLGSGAVEVVTSHKPNARQRVGDFARSWLRSKALKLGAGTARTYADALEGHVLAAFGDFYYDAVTSSDVQAWVDAKLSEGWTTPTGQRRRYSVPTVHGWFRVFRAMTRDAVHMLGLERDPTLRVQFPEAAEREESNSLHPDELVRFLAEMRSRYAQHYALTVVLAYSGLRFCHASALKWEDLDEAAGVVRVRRKQVRGAVGPVSRKKRAPREIPFAQLIVDILRAHRQQLIATQAPGVESGYMFPSEAGTLRTPGGLTRAWQVCAKAAGVQHRFTVHGLRFTFNDLARRARVDGTVLRSLTGHVTEAMTEHYSTVRIDEKRAALAEVLRLVPMDLSSESGDAGGDAAKFGPARAEGGLD